MNRGDVLRLELEKGDSDFSTKLENSIELFLSDRSPFSEIGGCIIKLHFAYNRFNFFLNPKDFFGRFLKIIKFLQISFTFLINLQNSSDFQEKKNIIFKCKETRNLSDINIVDKKFN